MNPDARDEDEIKSDAIKAKIRDTAPEKIFLNVGPTDIFEDDDTNFNDLDGVTWNKNEAIDGYDVEYIRADLASTAPSLAAAPAIAGALFDFAGYLTSLPQPVTLGASEWSAPAVDALTKWAAKRGLSLDDAEALGWQNLLAPAAPSEKGKEE